MAATQTLGDMIDITADFSKIMMLMQWIQSFPQAFDEPAVMGGVARMVGSQMQAQFDSEGSAFGTRWQPLSRMTQQTRTSRGFNPKHPILQQKGSRGGLKMITADALARWEAHRGQGTWTDGKGTTMTATIANRTFRARAHGPKMDNHYGGSSMLKAAESQDFTAPKGQLPGYLPSRPFFGFDGSTTDEMAQEVAALAMSEWQSLGGKMRGLRVRRTRGRILILGNQKKTHRGAIVR